MFYFLFFFHLQDKNKETQRTELAKSILDDYGSNKKKKDANFNDDSNDDSDVENVNG